MNNFRELSNSEMLEVSDLIHIVMDSGFCISIDATYVEQVGHFKITLPTGEILDTKEIL